MQFCILLNIKEVNLNQFLELNNILLFLTSMRVKIYHFNTMLKLYKKTTTSINLFLWLNCLVSK